MTAEELRPRLRDPIPDGKGGFMAFCPCHSDGEKSGRRSLHVSLADGKLLLRCFSGCEFKDIVRALGIEPERPARTQRPPTGRRIAATFDYTDADGNLVYQVVRLAPKDFRARRPDGSGWAWNLKGVTPLPYRLPQVLEAIQGGERVFVVEGEACVEAVERVGLCGTCNHGGAGKWGPQHARHLAGADVVILPDSDEPGRRHAEVVVKSLQGVARCVRKVELPGLPEKGDVVDWLEAGGTREQLLALVDHAVEVGTADLLAPACDGSDEEEELRHALPAFPVDVLPDPCRAAVEEIARATGVPLEIPAVALLSVAGACIGRTRAVEIKRGWREHGNLWIAIVAPSGIGKSPAVSEVQEPVFRAEKLWWEAYSEAMRAHEAELDRLSAVPKKDRVAMPRPEPPVRRELIVDDATSEALTDSLTANPRGILWNRDELSGLILDLDRYAQREGGTKARLLSSYDAGPWKVSRRSRQAFVPRACISLFGTIQPDVLPTIFSRADAGSGFLPRFLFVHVRQTEPPKWTDETVSRETREALERLVE